MVSGLERALQSFGDKVRHRPRKREPRTASSPIFDGVCRVRQHGDTMACACGLQYDTNDGDPPICRATGTRAPENGQARRP